MMTKRYFKFNNKLMLPVLVQLEGEEHLAAFGPILEELGLVEMTHDKALGVKVSKHDTTIINLSYSSSKLERSICSHYDAGSEITYQAGAKFVNKMTNTSMLLHSRNSVYWQMAIVHKANYENIKCSINRALTLALSKLGIIGFWGVKAKDTLLVTSKIVSKSDCIFVDYKNKKVFDSERAYNLDDDIEFGRLDESVKFNKQIISKESLYSFLMTNNSFLSLEGMSKELQNNIMAISINFNGYLYPEKNFEQKAVEINQAS